MITSPIKAIRAHCLECSAGSSDEVRHCPVENCALYPFRFGRNPFHARSRENRTGNGAQDSKSAVGSAGVNLASNDSNGTDGEILGQAQETT